MEMGWMGLRRSFYRIGRLLLRGWSGISLFDGDVDHDVDLCTLYFGYYNVVLILG